MSVFHCPISTTQLSKGKATLCQLQGPPKLPVGQGKPRPLEDRWALGWDSLSAEPQATCRKKHKQEENCSHTPLLNPMPQPSVLGPPGGLPSPQELLGHGAASQVVGRGGKGHRYESCLPLLSYLGWLIPFIHRCTLGGRGRGGWPFLPLQKGIGAGGGGSGRSRIQRKSCVWGKLWHCYGMTHLKGHVRQPWAPRCLADQAKHPVCEHTVTHPPAPAVALLLSRCTKGTLVQRKGMVLRGRPGESGNNNEEMGVGLP